MFVCVLICWPMLAYVGLCWPVFVYVLTGKTHVTTWSTYLKAAPLPPAPFPIQRLGGSDAGRICGLLLSWGCWDASSYPPLLIVFHISNVSTFIKHDSYFSWASLRWFDATQISRLCLDICPYDHGFLVMPSYSGFAKTSRLRGRLRRSVLRAVAKKREKLNLVLVLIDYLASVRKFILTRLGLSSGQVWLSWGHLSISGAYMRPCWAVWRPFWIMPGWVGLYRCHVVAIWGASWAKLERYGRESVGNATQIGYSGP
jgi:hypothetical protein